MCVKLQVFPEDNRTDVRAHTTEITRQGACHERDIFPSHRKWETVFRKMPMPCSHRLNAQVPKGPYSSKNCEINKDRVSEKKQFF